MPSISSTLFALSKIIAESFSIISLFVLNCIGISEWDILFKTDLDLELR